MITDQLSNEITKMPEFSKRKECFKNDSYTFSEYCEISTCAGVIDWHRAKWICGRLFWTLILALALGSTIWQVLEAFKDYLCSGDRFQTVITTKAGLDEIGFPNITVCNFNRINRTKMLEKGVTDQRVFEYAFAALPVLYHLSIQYLRGSTGFDSKGHEEAWNSFVRSKHNGKEPSLPDLLDEFGHDCEATVTFMAFGGVQYLDPCKKLKPTVWITHFGKCFVFDLSQHRQLLAGLGSGLQMIISPGLNEYLNGSVVSNFLEEGILIMFDYKVEAVITNPVVVAPGRHAYIALTATQQIYKEETYPVFDLPCQKNASLNIFNGDYSKKMCTFECVYKSFWDLCKCMPSMQAKPGQKVCTVNKTIDCLTRMMSNQNLIKEARNCSTQCKDPCPNFTSVSAIATYAQYPIQSSVQEISKYLHQQSFSKGLEPKNAISIDAYFPTMEVISVITSEATPVFTFIGNLGGQLGLWTGMCFMTIIQAVYFLMAACLGKICVRKRTEICQVMEIDKGIIR